MRSIAYIKPTFWTRGSGKKLRGNSDAIALAFYVMTAPQSTYVGLYYSSLAQIANDLGWDVNRVRLTFPAISEIASYDEEAELVWVPATLKHQIGDEMGHGDKRRSNIAREVSLIGDHRFASEFMELYSEAYALSQPGKPAAKASKAPPPDTKSEEERRGPDGASGGSRGARMGHPEDRAGRGSPSTRSYPDPIPPRSRSLEGPGNLSGPGSGKISAADFVPSAENVELAQELGLTEEQVKAALGAFKKKVKKKCVYVEHAQSFLNFLQSEAKPREKNSDSSDNSRDSEEDKPAKPAALFWYEHHLERGELEEAEKYRLKCVKLGLMKGEN